jgi:2-succinyl-5-enolpyruvyl-6-hydroxy-3-cyclohexene-1-carboxylate synthase
MGGDGVKPTANGTFTRAFIAHLAASGVTRFVLCPGSRSGPLAHVLAEAASSGPPVGAPNIDLHVRIDERVAGFVALGLAQATGEPVAVVTTSGTAVGNLLPAVMEAHHAGLRLVLVTADRPFEMRGTGANQATDQRRLFGTFVQWSGDILPPGEGRDLDGEAARLVETALAYAAGAAPPGHPAHDTVGPVHINLQFEPPLGPDYGDWPHGRPAEFSIPPEPSLPPLPDVERGVVIAGHGAGPAAATIAMSRGWPLFAEPSSGARSGASCISGYAEALESPRANALVDDIEFILVVGRPTLSRVVAGLVQEAPRLWVARHGGRWREAPAHAEVVARDVPFEWVRTQGRELPREEPSSWLSRWKGVGRDPVPALWALRSVAAAVVASVKAGGVLVVGSSGPIRALDAVLPATRIGDMPRILSNRGLAGIDGTVSTAMGVALGGVGPVTAFMGDVTFLHDIGGLLVGTRERVPDVRIVVANDGGGTIFGGLEHAAAREERFERVFTTPHGADLASLVAGYGARHVPIYDGEALAEILEAPPTGVEVIEAVMTVPKRGSTSGVGFVPGPNGD